MGWTGGIGRIAGAILLLLTIQTAVAYAEQPREARTFQNVILAGKTHLTAIAVGE